jgi:hypothetical protein
MLEKLRICDISKESAVLLKRRAENIPRQDDDSRFLAGVVQYVLNEKQSKLAMR